MKDEMPLLSFFINYRCVAIKHGGAVRVVRY